MAGNNNPDLQELKRLHAAATKGEMSVGSYHTLLDADGKHVLFTGVQTPMTPGPRQDQARANMAEYAAIHNAFPLLLERLERAEAERDSCQRQCRSLLDGIALAGAEGDARLKRDGVIEGLESALTILSSSSDDPEVDIRQAAKRLREVE
jgi:hypothetical protein